MKSLNDDLQMRSDWFMPIATGKERIKSNGLKAHSTQKPEGLLYRILLSSSNPADIVLDPFFGSGTTGAVAKKLGRHFIGIEREHDYIKIAEERIASIIPVPLEAIEFPNPRRQTRVPFGALLEANLIQPGQHIYFLRNGITAVILASGHIRCGEETGSIHGIAKSLSNGAPVNGWDCWFIENNNGVRIGIDILRKKLLAHNSGVG
jgi:modification methylase